MKENKIINKNAHFLLTASLILFLFPLNHSRADSKADGKKALLSVRKMIASVRLKKYEKALEYIGLDEMSRYLLDKYYGKLTPDQRSKFKELLGKYMRKRAFPQARKYIGSVGVTYDKPKIRGKKILVKSSVIYGGSERLVFTWVLTRVADKYLITDFLNIQGKSSLKKSRDKQILPVYRKRGIKGLLKALRKTIKKL